MDFEHIELGDLYDGLRTADDAKGGLDP